jgi:predicted secreted protein
MQKRMELVKNVPKSWLTILSLATVLLVMSWSTVAQASDDKDGAVASIEVTTSKDVLQDEVRVVMGTRLTGQSAGAVNQALGAALKQARVGLQVAGDVRISSGGFSTFPSYDKDGKVIEWAGNADLVIVSKNLEGVSAVIEHLGTSLAISSIQFSLSDQTRREQQALLMQSLADEFVERATITTKAFGFHGYRVMALDFVNQDQVSPRPLMMRAAAPMLDGVGPVVSLEPSMTSVEVSVIAKIHLH